MTRLLALTTAFLLLLAGGRARADLGDDVDALSNAWQREGTVLHLSPQLHERGETRYVSLPARALRSKRNACTTLAILGVPSASFVLSFEGKGRNGSPPLPIRSQAGVVEVTRCERGRRALRGVAIELRSPRAVLETLVLLSDAPPGEAYRVLPERLPGPTGSAIDPGPAPNTGDIVERAKDLVARMARRGADEIDHGLLRSDLDGSGLSAIELDEGCHELRVLGVPTPERAPRSVDIDADIVWPSGELAASDRTNAPDASVRLCVAQKRQLALRFSGALPTSPVLFVHGRWTLPAALDPRWPPEVRAGLAEALWEHDLRPPVGPVYAQSLGIAGITGIPFEIEPDTCYVVAAAVHRGQSAGLAVGVAVGPHRYQNHGGPEGQNAALAFCARGQQSALVEVEAVGSAGLTWLLGLWQAGKTNPGEIGE